MAHTKEEDIAIAILKIAAANAKGIATFKKAYSEIPNLVVLSAADKSQSITRPGEPMWHQIVRNIKSHHTSESNFIKKGYLIHIPNVGYQITAAGKAYLAQI